MKHILETREQFQFGRKSLCGEPGQTVYKPTESDCDDCLELFKKIYPEAWAEWTKRAEEAKE